MSIQKSKSLVLFGSLLVLVLLSGCAQSLSSAPTPVVPLVNVDVDATVQSAVQTQVGYALAEIEKNALPTNTPFPLSTPTLGLPSLPNPPQTDFVIRTFIKKGSTESQTKDEYLVKGKWTDGKAAFQSAVAEEWMKAHGANSFDLIWDQDVPNVSMVLVPPITAEQAQELAKLLGASRIGYVYAHPQGLRECMQFDTNPAWQLVRIHLYDRGDWTPYKEIFCPNLNVTPTPTAIP